MNLFLEPGVNPRVKLADQRTPWTKRSFAGDTQFPVEIQLKGGDCCAYDCSQCGWEELLL
jgi:hypothetical protein